MSFPRLFSPIRLGGVEIPNRVVMAPMGVGRYRDDENWPKIALRYFEERAAGGAGLILTQTVRVHGSLASRPGIGLHDDRFIPSHAELADRMHRHGAKIFCQLGLQGGKGGNEAPSAIYSVNYKTRPRALTSGELYELVESFIRAAGRAREAGYDGVEFHGAHSYLVGSLMSPALNLRDDEWGGDFERRMKFVREVIEGIRREYPGFPVGFKYSAYEEIPGGVDIPLGLEIAKYAARLGVAYLHVSSTSSTIEVYSRYASVPPLYLPRNTLLPLAEEVKRACPDIPVMAAGSITVPGEAEDHLASGKCDLVALGRTLIADPFWPEKARRGDTVHIIPCIRCNVCHHQLWLGKFICCSLNPHVAREAEQDLAPSARKKKVLVIGAGPAGIRCALTAARRGHEVTLYEKRPYIGGMMFPGSRPSCKADMARALDWFTAELESSAVRVKLNTEVTPEMAEAENPDALVLAFGTEPVRLDVPGAGLPHVHSAVEVLRDVSKFGGRRAVVVGGGDVGCETACHLADHGFEVAIVEVRPRLMEENAVRNLKLPLFELLREKGVRIFTETRVNAFTPEGVEVILPNGKQYGIPADLAAVAAGLRADSDRARKFSLSAEEVHFIGDCDAPGRIREATEAGERVGRLL